MTEQTDDLRDGSTEDEGPGTQPAEVVYDSAPTITSMASRGPNRRIAPPR